MDLDNINEDDTLNIEQKVTYIIQQLDTLIQQQLEQIPALQQFMFNVFDVFGESNAVSVAVLDQFIQKADEFYNKVLHPVSESLLDLLRNLKSSSFFAKQIYKVGFMLAEVHQADDNLLLACKVLASIDLDKPQITADDQVELCVTCAEFYLALNDTTSANKFISRVHRVVKSVNDITLVFRYKTSYARILDAQRRFLEAARRYLELSQLLGGEQERMISLENAVTCAILAKAGVARARIIGSLYRDERTVGLKNYRMLQTMFYDQIVSPDEEEKFSSMLSLSQNVSLGNGMTVWKQAVFEHNLLATSKIYENIRFEEMGLILSTSPEQVHIAMLAALTFDIG